MKFQIRPISPLWSLKISFRDHFYLHIGSLATKYLVTTRRGCVAEATIPSPEKR